jgi:macrolide transport system ATP-binding/permease protein
MISRRLNMQRTPPRLALFLLRLWLSGPSYEAVAGDLYEEYQDPSRSPSWFWQQTFGTIKPLWAPPVWSAVSPMRIVRGTGLLTIRQDLSYAVRTLRKSPGFTVIVISAIALGIGINTAIFSLLNALAFRPVPVHDPDRVVSIYQIFHGNVERHVAGTDSLFSYPEFKQYQRENQVLSGLTAFTPVRATLSAGTGRLVQGEIVSCNYFPVLESQPVLGRGFSESECRAERASPVLVLSDALWRSQFHADPNILGRIVTLNRVAFTVIGVASPQFFGAGAETSEFWAPVTMQQDLKNVGPGISFLPDANLSWLYLIGRVKPGVSAEQVRANLALISGRIDRLYPGRTTQLAIDRATLFAEPEERHNLLSAGYIILGGVSLVLLIACANVANLLLARAAFRHREIALRLSVGASRGRLVRQLLTESLLLSFAGGILGSALAFFGSEAAVGWLMTSLPEGMVPKMSINLRPDPRMLLYTVSLCLLTGLVFGLVPALESTRIDLNSGLRDEFLLAGRRTRTWLRGMLVGAQVAICLIVLIAAGLLARGVSAAQHIEPGFNTHAVLVANFNLRREGYDEARTAVFKAQLLQRTRGFAGDANVSLSAMPPLSGGGWSESLTLEGAAKPTGSMIEAVSPTFFNLLGLPLVAGRSFTAQEADTSAKVAIISQSGARKLWPGHSPLGMRFRFGDDKVFTEIVGVAHDAYLTDLNHVRDCFLFLQAKNTEPQFSLLIKNPDEAATARSLRAAVTSLDPNLYFDISTIDGYRRMQELPTRALSVFSSVLGAFALLLACSGIYGVVNYSANHRVKEIGIRMTLGAHPREVLRMMMQQSLRPVLIGALVGVVGAAAATRLLSSMLYGVSPFDAWTFAGVVLLIIGASFLATYGPAHRATRIDPATALRHE